MNSVIHSVGPLERAVYCPTAAFRRIELHTCVCRAEDRGLVAITGPADDPESEADADLFAAAPELLAACEALLIEFDTWVPDVTDPFSLATEERIRAAVAKAKGGRHVAG